MAFSDWIPGVRTAANIIEIYTIINDDSEKNKTLKVSKLVVESIPDVAALVVVAPLLFSSGAAVATATAASSTAKGAAFAAVRSVVGIVV